MRPLVPLAAAVALLVAPAVADASPTLERSKAIADAWYHGQPCTGKLNVVYDSSLSTDGETRGLWWRPTSSGRWEMYARSCDVALRPGLTAARECWVLWHEAGHLAYAREEHTGDLHAKAKGPSGCNYLEPTPPSRRALLKGAIHATLPSGYLPWRVVCGRNAQRMRCRAESSQAKHVRRYEASITGSFRRVS